jgi:hypothetical protein
MTPLACQTIASPAFMEKIPWWSIVLLHPRDEAKLTRIQRGDERRLRFSFDYAPCPAPGVMKKPNPVAASQFLLLLRIIPERQHHCARSCGRRGGHAGCTNNRGGNRTAVPFSGPASILHVWLQRITPFARLECVGAIRWIVSASVTDPASGTI